jgi:hypothetical protein
VSSAEQALRKWVSGCSCKQLAVAGISIMECNVCSGGSGNALRRWLVHYNAHVRCRNGGTDVGELRGMSMAIRVRSIDGDPESVS